jgi:delta(3,5)-delta(2,4)-dienoyl-CoA isomerase
MWLELRNVFDHLSHDPSTRVVVLSGAGPKAFTAGLDVAAASEDCFLGSNESSPAASESKDGARTATELRRYVSEMQHCVSAIERCEKPVVAALHGYTIGLGIDIAVCADVRICAADMRFAVKEVDIGLAADVGTLSRLGKVVGNGSWIKDVCLSARDFGAEEALRVGLVSWVAEATAVGGKDAVMKEALRWAAIVAGKSPVAVQGTKELLNWSQDHSVQDGEPFKLILKPII